jgi:competence protein ComEA
VDATRSHVHPPDAAWPHAAQLAAAFLLGAAAALLAVRVLQAPSGRPFDLVAAPPLDLNRAEAADLLQLPGVGPTLANRIVDVRDSRGGFRNADDLRSVPGVGPARLEKLRPWVRGNGLSAAGVTVSKKLDAGAEPIDVNRASVEDLQRIPGVGPKTAQRIIDERAKRQFATVEDLRRVSGLGAKTLEKMHPFVTARPVE